MPENYTAPTGTHVYGLQHDLEAFIDRRKTLTLLASASASAATVLTACDGFPFSSRSEPDVVGAGANGRECVAQPRETAGPFPADGSNSAHGTLANVLSGSGIVREDMRSNLGNEAGTASGERLDVEFSVVDVNNSCAPLVGYAVYLWHCDAQGRYSIYDLPDASYLRAVGVTDAAGTMNFTTIFPGCYPGRYPHMHFEVYSSLEQATNYRNRILTSQLAMPQEACRLAYASQFYGVSRKNLERSPLDRDGIFSNNTPKQLSAQTLKRFEKK